MKVKSCLTEAKSVSKDAQRVGRGLRMRRIACGLSRARLAMELGISLKQLRAFELGLETIPPVLFASMAEKLLVDVAYFFQSLDPVSDIDHLLRKPLSDD